MTYAEALAALDKALGNTYTDSGGVNTVVMFASLVNELRPLLERAQRERALLALMHGDAHGLDGQYCPPDCPVRAALNPQDTGGGFLMREFIVSFSQETIHIEYAYVKVDAHDKEHAELLARDLIERGEWYDIVDTDPINTDPESIVIYEVEEAD
ncbi:MAG: hypothetical protein ACRDGA_04685 [Bacteroidota bacterium]